MQKVIAKIHSARKTLVAVVAAAYLILGQDNSTLTDVVAVLTALGVYAAPNKG
jgi:hypothetical protein